MRTAHQRLGLRWVAGFVVALSLAFAAPSSASAQQDEFRAVIQQALAKVNAGDWEEARRLFLEAHRIRPSAEALRMAAVTSYELGEYTVTIGHAEEALAVEVHGLNEERRADAEELIARARRFTTELTLSVVPEAASANARVLVDGRSVEVGESVLVDHGDHVIEVAAAGYTAHEETLTLRERERDYPIRLVPLAGLSPRDAAATTLGDSPATRGDAPLDEPRRRTGLWVTIAVIGAAIIATAIVVPLALQDDGTTIEQVDPPDIILTVPRP